MIVQKIPLFHTGKILSVEMLNALTYELEKVNSQKYLGYSDGILRGFQIEVADEYLIVNEGSYIYQGELLCIPQKAKVLYKKSDSLQVLVLRTGDMEQTNNFRIREAEFKIIPEENCIITDIEICRFFLQQGAKLRNQYQNFRDMNTTFDTVCLCHSKWSAYGENSVAYPILAMFGQEIMNKEKPDIYDELLLNAINNSSGESIPQPVIIRYLTNKLERKLENPNQEDIFKGLVHSLEKGERRAERRTTDNRSAHNRIIIE